MSAPNRFTGRVALVTGGASGIGLATAKRLGSEGATVVIADLRGDKAEAAAVDVQSTGAPAAWGTACDVSSGAQVAAAVAGTLQSGDLFINQPNPFARDGLNLGHGGVSNVLVKPTQDL